MESTTYNRTAFNYSMKTQCLFSCKQTQLTGVKLSQHIPQQCTDRHSADIKWHALNKVSKLREPFSQPLKHNGRLSGLVSPQIPRDTKFSSVNSQKHMLPFRKQKLKTICFSLET